MIELGFLLLLRRAIVRLRVVRITARLCTCGVLLGWCCRCGASTASLFRRLQQRRLLSPAAFAAFFKRAHCHLHCGGSALAPALQALPLLLLLLFQQLLLVLQLLLLLLQLVFLLLELLSLLLLLPLELVLVLVALLLHLLLKLLLLLLLSLLLLLLPRRHHLLLLLLAL